MSLSLMMLAHMPQGPRRAKASVSLAMRRKDALVNNDICTLATELRICNDEYLNGLQEYA
jgi:hypothetical protein